MELEIKPNNYSTLRPEYKNRENCKYCCNKLPSRDWLSEILYFEHENIPEYVEVRFKNTRKVFCRNINKLNIKNGDTIVVENSTGNDMGIVSLTSPLVVLQMKKRGISKNSDAILDIIRIATERDKSNWEENKSHEYDTMVKARKIAQKLRVSLKINDVEFQADRKKATFFYTAEGRVDFRELIKEFAKEFRTKIEMRQIGIRQESGRVGGIGDCGRELCCSLWLSEFTTVPTIAAKQQNLYLNPSKLSGQCSRLKCCLNYELDIYLEAFEKFPDENIILRSGKGDWRVFKIDILREIMWFVRNKSEELISPIAIHIDNVHKIIDLNRKKVIPPDFDNYIERIDPEAIAGEIVNYSM